MRDGEVETAVRQPLHGLVAVTGGLKCAGDDKQSHEEHENRPVHQPQQLVGAELRAGQVNARGG